jgi:erythronate-4-phosphate dehydrogenase
MKVIADNKIPFLQGVLEPFVDVEYYPGKDIDNRKVKDADALIIRTRTKCNANLLDGTKVKFIATATIGFDHIDTEYCEAKGIAWTNAPGCNSGSVMQYIASTILSWAKDNKINIEDRVLGVVGVGNVGRKVVSLAENLGMQVLLNDPPRERAESKCGYVSLNGILRDADIISLHVPLNYNGIDKTFHMVDDNFLSQLNNGTLLINSSRGKVVNTASLKKFMAKNSPEYTVLDVWENEPDLDLQLLKEVFYATPHIAGYSTDGKANGTTMSVQAISKFFDLGIDDWEPDSIPLPKNSLIEYDGLNKNFQQIVTDLVLNTYQIQTDSDGLKSNPENFENFRGDYRLRREFFAFKLQLENVAEEFRRRLRRLGFKIIDK